MEALDIQTQLDERWLAFWWALIIGGVALLIAWRQGFFQPFTSSYALPIQGLDVIRGFGLFLVAEVLIVPIYFAAGFGITDAAIVNQNPYIKGWLYLAMIFGGFAAACLAYTFLSKEKKRLLWHQNDEAGHRHTALGIVAWFICFPVVLAFNQLISIVLWHLSHQPFEEQSLVLTLREVKQYPSLYLAIAVTIVTLVPFTEEFLFRGLLQTWLKRKFKRPWAAIALTSVIFALFHYSKDQGISNIEVLSTLFLLSCMLGYLFERQKSLWAPIGLHSFFNLMSATMLLFDRP